MQTTITISLLVFEICAIAQVSYRNYKIYQVVPSSNRQFNAVETFKNNPQVTFLNMMCKETQPLNIMVSPDFQYEFEVQLNQHRINFQLLTEDVERLIIEEKQAQKKITFKANETIRFDKYYRYSEIQDYLKQLTNKHPKVVSIENYGLSYENRNLTLIRISTGGHQKKPIIFVDAGMHAMEWIGPSQALYIINQLVENSKNKYLIETVDWIVAPLLNPDGYEYSHTRNRLWRKTRSKGKRCHGVDPNRNFDFHWMEVGASTHECSFFYGGPSAFSESETLALSEVVKKYASSIKLYLTFHGPAKCMLYPWGYKPDLPENFQELHNLAQEAARAIYAVNGTDYILGSSFNNLNPTSGSSRDWVYGAAGVDLAYAIELPPGGKTGFDVPPERILGIVQEMFEGVKVFHRYVKETFSN